MNCNEFAQRMHQRLDDRRSLEGDDELCRHARACESCRMKFHAWRQIASIMPTHTRGTGPHATAKKYFPAVPAVAGLAAAILFTMIVLCQDEDSIAPPAESATTHGDQQVLAQTAGQLDPARWWRSVQDRDWVGQTMPAVRSVSQGVAPLGRSLMRAVTILTIGGRERTS